MIKAPWTQEQVDALNQYQQAGKFHPFTCGDIHDGDRTLIATKEGWVCGGCSYTQDWAHELMLAPTERY